MKDCPLRRILVLLFISSLVVFSLHSLITKTSVFADAKHYYSYSRSIIFDHDLLLGNEFFKFGLLEKDFPNIVFSCFYPPGVSIFWLPLFYVAYGFMNLLQIFVPTLNPTGYEVIFEYACAITNILLGISGFYFVFQTLRKYFTDETSLFTITTLFLTTNLFFYIAVEPINSHAASFFISALFVFYFFNSRKEKYYYLILGVIGGVAGIVRTQDLLLLALPLMRMIRKVTSHKSSIKILSACYLLFSTGVLIGFLPQILLWKYFYGTFWYSPYFDVGFSFFKPQILHVLFNSQNGLFVTTPIVAFAVLFLIFQVVKSLNKKLNGKWKIEDGKYFYALLYFFLQLYLVSSWNVYTQGGSYSIRMMVTTYPLLAFGLANIINMILKKYENRRTIYVIGGFTLLNFTSILIYLLKY